jgi:RNA polymerase sigma-70 factor (ECF subfamily)
MSPETPAPSPPSGAAGDDRGRIAGFLAGNEEALAEVRRWVRGALHPYRLRLAAELEDLEQEVLSDLLAALRGDRFRGESLLATYVRRMVHHKCLTRLRNAAGRPTVGTDEVELVDPTPSPFERARREGDLALALRVLASMPAGCRELWDMIHRGLSYEAMSERLGVAAGTLRVRVLRCRARALALRDRLAAGNDRGNPATEERREASAAPVSKLEARRERLGEQES